MAKFTARTLTAPIAAFTMACIVFAYTRSSIHSAKMSVSERRRQDGGAVDLRREGLRQRGIDVSEMTKGESREEEQIREAIERRGR